MEHLLTSRQEGSRNIAEEQTDKSLLPSSLHNLPNLPWPIHLTLSVHLKAVLMPPHRAKRHEISSGYFPPRREIPPEISTS